MIVWLPNHQFITSDDTDHMKIFFILYMLYTKIYHLIDTYFSWLNETYR